MRDIRKIIVHCSDSDINSHDDISVIRDWHLQRGFRDVGYHYFIKKDGTIQNGRPHSEQGAHTLGHNSDSIGICLHGRDEFTSQQFATLINKVRELQRNYILKNKDVYGHNEFSTKTCPNFDVSKIFNRYVGNLNPKTEKRV